MLQTIPMSLLGHTQNSPIPAKLTEIMGPQTYMGSHTCRPKATSHDWVDGQSLS